MKFDKKRLILTLIILIGLNDILIRSSLGFLNTTMTRYGIGFKPAQDKRFRFPQTDDK